MAEIRQGWVERHFWGAVQSLLALLGLCFMVWAHFHPYSSPSVQEPVKVAADAGAAMTLPLPLTVILVLLFLAVLIPNAWKMIRKSKPSHISLPAPSVDDPCAGLFTPLQIEAFTLAKDLRDFYASLAPFPENPAPNEGTAEDMVRYVGWSDQQGKWRQKLLHAYANRKFGERITKLMHQMGEEFEYPAYAPDYAEDLRIPGKDSIPKLAQDMEMLAIWINRKQRNEVYIKG